MSCIGSAEIAGLDTDGLDNDRHISNRNVFVCVKEVNYEASCRIQYTVN